MLTEIVPGQTYLRRDGVRVVAFINEKEPDYQGGSLILVKESAESKSDGLYRWRYSGARPKNTSATWADVMVAGQVPRARSTAERIRQHPFDLVECVSVLPREVVQLELF